MKPSKLLSFIALIIGTLALAGCVEVPGYYGGYGYPAYSYGGGEYPAYGYTGWNGGWWGEEPHYWGHHDWDRDDWGHDDWGHGGWGHWGGLGDNGWAFAGHPQGFGQFGNRGFNVAHNGHFGFGGRNFAHGGFGGGGFHGSGFHGGGFNHGFHGGGVHSGRHGRH